MNTLLVILTLALGGGHTPLAYLSPNDVFPDRGAAEEAMEETQEGIERHTSEDTTDIAVPAQTSSLSDISAFSSSSVSSSVSSASSISSTSTSPFHSSPSSRSQYSVLSSLNEKENVLNSSVSTLSSSSSNNPQFFRAGTALESVQTLEDQPLEAADPFANMPISSSSVSQASSSSVLLITGGTLPAEQEDPLPDTVDETLQSAAPDSSGGFLGTLFYVFLAIFLALGGGAVYFVMKKREHVSPTAVQEPIAEHQEEENAVHTQESSERLEHALEAMQEDQQVHNDEDQEVLDKE